MTEKTTRKRAIRRSPAEIIAQLEAKKNALEATYNAKLAKLDARIEKVETRYKKRLVLENLSTQTQDELTKQMEEIRLKKSLLSKALKLKTTF